MPVDRDSPSNPTGSYRLTFQAKVRLLLCVWPRRSHALCLQTATGVSLSSKPYPFVMCNDAPLQKAYQMVHGRLTSEQERMSSEQRRVRAAKDSLRKHQDTLAKLSHGG